MSMQTCVDDEDDWETPTKQELMDMLERLNVLPKSESPLEDSTFEDAVFADDSRNVEKDAIGMRLCHPIAFTFSPN